MGFNSGLKGLINTQIQQKYLIKLQYGNKIRCRLIYVELHSFFADLKFTQQWVCRLWSFCIGRHVVCYTRNVSKENYASIFRVTTCCLHILDSHPEYGGRFFRKVCTYLPHSMSYNALLQLLSLTKQLSSRSDNTCILVVPGRNLCKRPENTDSLFVVFLGSSKFQNKLQQATTVYSHILVTVSFIIILPTDDEQSEV